MLGSSLLKKYYDVYCFVLFCFIAWERKNEKWPIQAYLWKIMVSITSMFMQTTVCKDKYLSKSQFCICIDIAVKSILTECQFFSIGRGKAGSRMSRRSCSGVLSLESRGYMAFKEDKDWLCYKRTSHFLERKVHWFFRKMQTHCELQGTAI